MNNELQKLATLLTNAKIPFEFNSVIGTNDQICYPSCDHKICDAICHKYSYGYDAGLLEIMGLTKIDFDDVEGWLTAEEVFTRIKEDYERRN